MKTTSGHNVSQGGESKWAKVLPELIKDLGLLAGQQVAASHVKGMEEDFRRGEGAIDAFESGTQTPMQESAFKALRDPNMSMVGEAIPTEKLSAYNKIAPKMAEVDAATQTGSLPKGKVREYDVSKLPPKETDVEFERIMSEAANEPPQSSFQNQPPPDVMGMPKVPMGVGMEPQAPPQDPTQSAFNYQKRNIEPKHPPIILEGMEFKNLGVPPEKIQRMLTHQMEVATYVAGLPKALQGAIEPYLHVLESQQKWLMDNYGKESQMLNKLLQDAYKAKRDADEKALGRRESYQDKVSFEEDVAHPNRMEEINARNKAILERASKKGLPPEMRKRLVDNFKLEKSLDELVALRKKLEPKLGWFKGKIESAKQNIGLQEDKDMSNFITLSRMKVPGYVKAAIGGRITDQMDQRFTKILHRPDSSKEQFDGVISALRSLARAEIESINVMGMGDQSGLGEVENQGGGTNLLSIVTE